MHVSNQDLSLMDAFLDFPHILNYLLPFNKLLQKVSTLPFLYQKVKIPQYTHLLLLIPPLSFKGHIHNLLHYLRDCIKIVQMEFVVDL